MLAWVAVQVHRVTHVLWTQSRRALALALQSNVFAVDIHSDATIGKGILLDHATGLSWATTSPSSTT